MPKILRVDLRTLELKISRGENLPVLPQIVSSVFKLVDDPKTTPREVELVIGRDAALTAKILRVVNSPLYGVNQVTTIGRALAVLGMNTVRNLLISVAFQNLIVTRQESQRFNKHEYWRHSLAVATAAKIIGKFVMPTRSDELFSIGMLHDVGLIVLDKFCPDILDTSIRHAEQEEILLADAEMQIAGYSHAEIGGILAEKWGLGETVRDAIKNHHDRRVLMEKANYAAIIMIADVLAHQTGFTNQLPALTYDLDEEAIDSLGLPEEQFDAIRVVMCTEVEKAEQAFLMRSAA